MADRPERELDASLRRVDWRFLLPTPRPRRVLSPRGGPLAEAVGGIAGEVLARAEDCDLAVAEDPDEQTLTALREALAPGGACYTEWHLPLGGARRVVRALRAAGFGGITCYRPWPPGRPLYWIPLGAPGAAGYARSRRRLRGGRVRRFLQVVRHRLRDLAGGRYGGPICALAHLPGPRRHDAVDWIREQWPRWDLGPVPERLSALLVTGGPRSVSKVVLLVFAEPSPVPVVVVKGPRVDAAAAGIRREGAVLAGLAAASSRLAGMPRPLFLKETGGVPLVGETALPGRPLEGLLGPRNLRDWSLRVSDWLADLGRGRPPLPGEHWRRAIVEPVLAEFVERFGRVADRGLIRECEGIVRSIGALPPVPEQRDFGPWNLLAQPQGGLGVLDWESAVVEGLPALDLLYYLAYASFSADRARDRDSRLASYRRSLDPSNRTGAVRRECLARYLGALGLESACLPALRALVWLIHAQSDYRHAEADAGGTPVPEVLRRMLFLGLWEAELRDIARR